MSKTIESRDGLSVDVYNHDEALAIFGTCDAEFIADLLFESRGPYVRFDVESDDMSVTITVSW